MARRNIWSAEETKELLTVIKDLKLINSFGEERNNKLYELVEKEMNERGFHDKEAFQIEHKWKNLKRNYYKTKRENYLIESCEFYEELEELMAMKTTTFVPKPRVGVKRTKPALENFDILLSKINKVERENNEAFTRKEKDLIDYQFELYTQDERQSTTKLAQLLNRNMEDFCARAQLILVEDGIIDTLEDTIETVESADPTDEEIQIDPCTKKEIVKEYYQTWTEEEPF